MVQVLQRHSRCHFCICRRQPGRFLFDRGKSDHPHILKVFIGFRQNHFYLFSSTDFRLYRCQITHRLLRFHPRTARLAPARTVEDADVDAQFRGGFQCRVHHLPPCFTVEFDGTFARFTVFESDVADKGAVDADPLHRLQIAAYAVGADVVRNPVPVNRCLYRIGCFREARRQLVAGDGFPAVA